jgi:hypothetical protein
LLTAIPSDLTALAAESGVPASWQLRLEITSLTFMFELRAATGHPDVQRKHIVVLAGQDFIAGLDDQFVALIIEPVVVMVGDGTGFPQRRIGRD